MSTHIRVCERVYIYVEKSCIVNINLHTQHNFYAYATTEERSYVFSKVF